MRKYFKNPTVKLVAGFIVGFYIGRSDIEIHVSRKVRNANG